MAATSRQHLASKILMLRKHDRSMILLAFVGAFVAVTTALLLMQRGVAASHTENVLDCHFEGVAAHHHNADCYDAGGSLVCPLPERELHMHGESCYDAGGNLACGEEEALVEHVHGPGCFVTVEVEDGLPEGDSSDQQGDAGDGATDQVDNSASDANDEDGSISSDLEEEVAYPAQTLTQEFMDENQHPVLTVRIDAPEGVLPQGTVLQASWISPDALSKREMGAVERALAKKTDGKLTDLQAVDLSFVDADGAVVKPAEKVVVTLTSALAGTSDQPYMVHIDDLTPEQAAAVAQGDKEPKRNASVFDALSADDLQQRGLSHADDQISIESDAFSTYVLAVTTLPKTLQATDGESYTVTIDAPASAGVSQDAELQVREFSKRGKHWAKYVPQIAEALGDEPAHIRLFELNIVAGAQEVQVDEAIPVQMQLSDVDEFGEDVRAVHVGSDGIELLDTSVNGDVVTFDSAGPKLYAVVGTTLQETVLASDGQNYRVTVTAGPEAQIPSEAELAVEEILPDQDAASERTLGYEDYVARAKDALSIDSDAGEYVRLFDISIVDKDDHSIKYQPAEGSNVSVRIELADSQSEELGVVHFADGAEEGDKVENSTALADEGSFVEFAAEGFSVYAVVDEGDTSTNARMKVEFYNGDDLIASMIVKNSDTLEALETILYDPGVGTIEQGVLFDGWTLKKDYTLEDANNAMSIGEVREWAEARVITEFETVKLYAALVKTFTVTYLDEREASLGIDNVTMIAADTSVDYTVDMGYTPIDELHNFAGWNVKTGSSNIEGYTEGTTYENGTEITLTGNVVFSVNAPEGHWLIFNENGKGATYNAPVFVESGQGTVQPEKTKPENMSRSGYTFGGWYTDAACTPGNEYEFGDTISDNTTIYAKWTPVETTKYTLIVWRQSVSDSYDAADADKTYDFAFSTTINATTDTPISLLNLSTYQNKDGQTITVDGQQHSFYGFTYNTTKGVVANKDADGRPVTTVLPNGTTVVNLYYDREVVTYDFNVQGFQRVAQKPANNQINNGAYYVIYNGQYCPIRRENNRTYVYTSATDTNGTQYALIDGSWVELEYDYGTVGGVPGYYWWYQQNGSWRVWRGTRYKRSNTYINLQNYNVYIYDWYPRETFTGLYGQKLSKYGYVWPTDYRWFNDLGSNYFTSIQDTFGASVNDEPTSEFHTDYYGYATDMDTAVYHYLQNVDGSWPDTPTYTIPTAVGNGMVFRNFQGFTESEFRIKLPDGVTTYQTGMSYTGNSLNNPVTRTTSDGWTDWLPYGTGVEYEGNTRHETTRWTATEGGIEFRYTRNQYPLTYMVGRFENASGELLDPPVTGKLNEVTTIEYEDSLSSYAEGGDNYYEPEAQEGYAFAGWYIDSTCTTPVDFENSTMPLNGMTVYGKWVQAQYRVFLHPNTTDATLDWGSESQSMNFRVSMDGTVSVPNGRRTGYELVGWYLDEECTKSFNAEAFKLNEVTVTTPYDKTVDFTDVMDKWGNGATTNGDLDRFWITKKLDLYAKWRAVLEGANGIGVIYDANGGTNPPSDTTLYLDRAQSVAQGAPTPPAATGDEPQQVFLYWVMQRWDETQNKYVDIEGADHIYPGDNFEVLKDNARRVINEYYDDGVTIKDATYTIRLRAEYGNAESHTSTHIYWYANNASGNVIKTNTVEGEDREFFQINEAMPIKDPLDFPSVASVDSDGFYHFNNDNGGSYKFLGWARIPEEGGQDKQLGEDDLFLTWHEEDGGYYTAVVDGEVKHVTRVAADEILPYHDMYAVWQRWGYLKTGKHFDVQEFYLDGVDMESRWYALEFTIKDSDGNYVKLTDDTGTDVDGHYIYDGAQEAKTTITLSTFVHETSADNPHEHQYFIYAWVPVDTYVVEENHTQADELITGYERQNSAYSATAEVANSCVYGELDNIGSGEARIDNNYRGNNNYAYLKVEKQVAGDAPATLTNDKDYYFIVKNNTLDAYISTEDRTFTTDTSKIQVYKVKPGGALFYANTGNQVNGNHIQVVGENEYAVIELDSSTVPVAAPESPQIDGYVWEQSVSPATVVADKDAEKTIVITNTYTARYGAIKLEKLLDTEGNIPDGAADHEYQFTVTNAEGKYVADATGTLSDEEAILKVKPGEANALTLNNLLPGTYIVTEIKEDVETYAQTVTVAVGTGDRAESATAEVAVTKSQTSEVTFTNSYERQVTDIYLNKVDKNDQSVLLPGAEFKLYRKNADGTYAIDETIDATKQATTLVLTDGTLKLEGIPSGDYKLVELKAPEGYIFLTKDLYFTVNATAKDTESIITVTAGQTAYTDTSIGASTKSTATGKKDDTLVVPNEPGAELPSAGGSGTALTYLLGSLLMVAAGSWLVLRRGARP